MITYVSKFHKGSQDPVHYIVEDDDMYFSYDYPILVAYPDQDTKMIADLIASGLFEHTIDVPQRVYDTFLDCLT